MKTKILYVLSYISKNGGVQAVVNNYYNELAKKENLQIDFLVLLPGDSDVEKEITSKGANIYYISGQKEKNIFLFRKEIKKFFKLHHEYDIIHSHQTNLDFFYLREAKKYKIPVRIMHSHSTNCNINKVRMFITKKLSKLYSNYYFACSKEAGIYYFGKKFDTSKKSYIVNNAINYIKYKFDEEKREEVREKLDIKNKFVIGNVARMDENKNQIFLLEVFSNIKKQYSNSKLILIGDGPLKEQLIDYSKKLYIYDDVIFYGVTDKVAELLQAMDCFVLPSKYEGVPLTVIEAAASGIKYYISDSIDSHIFNNDYETKINLENGIEIWTNEILKATNEYKRKDVSSIIEDAGFNIQLESDKLFKYYMKILGR